MAAGVGVSGEAVLVVGSRGRMGATLARRMRAAGLGVRGLDGLADTTPEAAALRTLGQGLDLLLLCVPVTAVRDALRLLTPHLPPSCVVADITSVKVQPLRAMEEIWPGAVVGTHPLFGPLTEGELRVAIVPGARAGAAQVELVERVFQAAGCIPFRCDAEAHDKAMAAIHSLNYITSLVYFSTLAGHEEWLPFVTPSFKRRQDAAQKMLTEDGEMFDALFDANPYSAALVRQFGAHLGVAAAGDTSPLREQALWWWPDGTPRR